MSGKRGMNQYPAVVKVEAIRLFYEEGKTKKQIASTLGVTDKGRIKRWLQIYRREGFSGLVNKPKGRPTERRKLVSPEEKIRLLEMENELLRNFLFGEEGR
jgi:transposase-like protein